MPIEDRHFRQLADHLFDGVYAIDRERRIIYWNRAAEKITGYRRDEVVGSCCWHNLLIHVDSSGRTLCTTDHCPAVAVMKTGKVKEADLFLHHKEGHRLPVVTRILPMQDEGGQNIGAVEVFRDTSPLVAAQQEFEELERLCLLDPLTQIGNRRYLETQLKARIDELERYGWPFGVLFCDVDQFKRFNDEHGHPLGDEVLKMVAKTLANCVRPFDFVGRWGGDEFLAIIAKVQQWQIYAVAERIRAMVQQSVLTSDGGELIKVSISIGAAIAGPDDDQESLLKRVDELLYRSKRSGMNQVTLDT